MSNGNIHIIQKQSLEVTFNDLDNGMGMQNQIAEVFYERIQPKMEVLLDELFGENYHASIDRLEIDCGILNKKNWEQEFTEQAIRKLKEALVQVNKKEIDSKKIGEATAAETLLFFLENGFLPWNKRVNTLAELEDQLSVNDELVLQLKKLITKKEQVAERLCSQFSKIFVSKIIAQITNNRKKDLNEIFFLLEKLNPLQIDRRIIDPGLISAFAAKESEIIVPHFFTLIYSKVEENTKQVMKGLLQELVDYKIKNEGEKGERKTIETIYINNAGLVLLHPFLPILFEHLKLTEENKWLEKTLQHKSLTILEYLATGNDKFEEFNLALNKILCGNEINEMIAIDQQLDDDIKNECDNLLKKVIEHWKVLKNTSPDGLREAFLQRNGKLSKVDDGWLLQVEQKAIDVLLSHLPWGIGTIKLPLMKELLYTEW